MSSVRPLTPVPFDRLLRRIAHEWSSRHRIFDLPSARFWRRSDDVDIGTTFLGRPTASPLGPAAGPQSQMAQNVVLSWLGGSRIVELKTVQVDDELVIGRPCIDAEGPTYNTELSQELRIEQALEEYVKASMIIEILARWEPLAEHLGSDPGPHVLDMSVGYSLASVQSRKVERFIEAMKGADAVVERLRREIPAEFAFARDLDFRTAISNTVTLSTFHGCPPSEIEGIVRHLIDEHELDTMLKLNPTLLGFQRVGHILHDILGYVDVQLDPHAFPADLQFDRAADLIGRLARHAEARGRRFGVKLTNSLVVDNSSGRLADDPVYLSGAPLHVLATTLLDDLVNDLPGTFAIAGHEGPVQVSFSAGVNADNIADTLAMGVAPATVCSDLLEPGGYGRLEPMLRRLQDELRGSGVRDLAEWHQHRWRSAHDAGYRGPIEEHMSSLLGDSKTEFYSASATTKPVRRIDSPLQMWGCVACNLCVTVCPNDAIFSMRTPAGSALPGRQQYLVLAELCNDCGNCATFCPETGDPARVKPRLYFGQREFSSDRGQRFHLSTDGSELLVESAGVAELEAQRLHALLTSPEDSPPIVFEARNRRPRINVGRLVDRIADLASVGAIDGTQGCSRLALTDDDRAGRDLVVTWMRDLGLKVSIDGVGNVTGTMPWPDDTPAVMTGSHIDTVATGGRYDGNLGVLAGLEVIETVLQSGIQLLRPLSVSFFTDEEGARYPPDMLGSLVYSGGLPLEQALAIRGIDGTILGDELERIGYRGMAPVPARPPHAFVELHIEQGPVLERLGRRIGAVSGVQGISWTEVTLAGQSNHAGTTPMAMRRDPMLVAGALISYLHEVASDVGGGQVATVGKIDAVPNLVNVVPAHVTMTVDLRNPDAETLSGVERRVFDWLDARAEEAAVEVSKRTLARFEPVVFDEEIVRLVEAVASDHGFDALRMASGAGHDAQMLASVTRSGMIFVPSQSGLSHNPAEYTSREDIEAGTAVLLDVMLALATEV